MKRVKTIKQAGVRQSMLLAGLILASAGAQAAVLPKITATGIIGNSVMTQEVALPYDPSPWFGKAYTLEMTIDAEGAGTPKTEEGIPGLVWNDWSPNRVDYRLTIEGVPVFSGSNIPGGDLQTFSNFTVPQSLSGQIPQGVQIGHTYDSYLVFADNDYSAPLGCLDGLCDSAGDTSVNFHMGFQYFWDLSQYDAITDGSLPNLLNGAPYFTQGFGIMTIAFDQWSQATGSLRAGQLDSNVASVTVTPVPEAETYAMMLAGLGLVGMMVMRRRTLSK